MCPHVTFKGMWHDIPDAGINPLPVRRSVPLWLGGEADAVLRRIARLGDGWIILAYQPNEETRQQMRAYIVRLAAKKATLASMHGCRWVTIRRRSGAKKSKPGVT
jgi:alkanesulfonate monooxygenase SsuD/methylene tetrahydromethanopterin reductase-like flavin-dependent oxidoreductase (luciferase family)